MMLPFLLFGTVAALGLRQPGAQRGPRRNVSLLREDQAVASAAERLSTERAVGAKSAGGAEEEASTDAAFAESVEFDESDPRLASIRAALLGHFPSRGRRFTFVHIPKCAGTSFEKDFKRNLESSGEVCLMPHLHPSSTVMFFRSPRQHVLSQFVHCAHNPYHAGHHLPAAMRADYASGFPKWLDHFLASDGQASCPAYSLATQFKEYRTVCSASNSECKEHQQCRLRADFNCYNPSNMQARHLTCDRPQGAAGHYIGDEGAQPDVSQALQNLEDVAFVGIAELYAPSYCLFYAKVHGKIPQGCDCKFERKNWHRETHSAPAHTIETYPPEVLHKIDALTKVDQLVYEAALQRFVEEIRQAEKTYKEQLFCDDDKERLRGLTAYIPGLASRIGI